MTVRSTCANQHLADALAGSWPNKAVTAEQTAGAGAGAGSGASAAAGTGARSCAGTGLRSSPPAAEAWAERSGALSGRFAPGESRGGGKNLPGEEAVAAAVVAAKARTDPEAVGADSECAGLLLRSRIIDRQSPTALGGEAYPDRRREDLTVAALCDADPAAICGLKDTWHSGSKRRAPLMDLTNVPVAGGDNNGAGGGGDVAGSDCRERWEAQRGRSGGRMAVDNAYEVLQRQGGAAVGGAGGGGGGGHGMAAGAVGRGDGSAACYPEHLSWGAKRARVDPPSPLPLGGSRAAPGEDAAEGEAAEAAHGAAPGSGRALGAGAAGGAGAGVAAADAAAPAPAPEAGAADATAGTAAAAVAAAAGGSSTRQVLVFGRSITAPASSCLSPSPLSAQQLHTTPPSIPPWPSASACPAAHPGMPTASPAATAVRVVGRVAGGIGGRQLVEQCLLAVEGDALSPLTLAGGLGGGEGGSARGRSRAGNGGGSSSECGREGEQRVGTGREVVCQREVVVAGGVGVGVGVGIGAWRDRACGGERGEEPVREHEGCEGRVAREWISLEQDEPRIHASEVAQAKNWPSMSAQPRSEPLEQQQQQFQQQQRALLAQQQQQGQQATERLPARHDAPVPHSQAAHDRSPGDVAVTKAASMHESMDSSPSPPDRDGVPLPMGACPRLEECVAAGGVCVGPSAAAATAAGAGVAGEARESETRTGVAAAGAAAGSVGAAEAPRIQSLERRTAGCSLRAGAAASPLGGAARTAGLGEHQSLDHGPKQQQQQQQAAAVGVVRVVDIDGNLSDPQLCAPYAADIHAYLRTAERRHRPGTTFLEVNGGEISASMRGILMDWLVEVAEEYKLVPDTLYLTASYIDRFLAATTVTRNHLQLLGISCMLIASKYEEIYAPQVDEFCYITDNTYRREEVIAMERRVLQQLDFVLATPTTKSFLRRFIRAAQVTLQAPSLHLEFLGNFLAELSLLDYTCLRFLPSQLAAAAVFLAKLTLFPAKPPWAPALQHYTGYHVGEIEAAVRALHTLHVAVPTSSLPAIRVKYSQTKFQCVASIPPVSPATLSAAFSTPSLDATQR